MNTNVIESEIKRTDDMIRLINNRCESDPLIPRTLCTLSGSAEIDELREILKNYARVLNYFKENCK